MTDDKKSEAAKDAEAGKKIKDALNSVPVKGGKERIDRLTGQQGKSKK